MFTSFGFEKLLLAAALLSAPVEQPVDISEAQFPKISAELQKLAVRWEILDPREIRYVLARHQDVECDIKLLRRRYQDLQFAPPLHDCMRFPPRECISDMLAFNRAYRQHLDARQSVELVRWWDIREAICETDRLYQIWDAARDSRCEYYYVTVRRQALQRLRETLGPQNYYGGCMPPYVPIWRFQPID